MAEFPALPLFTDAFLGDTIELDAEETGAYLMLLIVSWRREDCALPDDDRRLARWARSTPKRWAKLRPVLEPFFMISDAGWKQKRLVDERQYVEGKRDAAAANGRLSALKRKGRHSTKRSTKGIASDERSDQLIVNEPPTPTPTPTPTVKDDVKTSSPKKRGSRLPEDWMPDPLPAAVGDLVAQWPPDREGRLLDEFRDYWTSRITDAAKLNWQKTWHNRIRDQHDRIMRENRNGHVANQPSLRGLRPDPSLDLLRSAEREIAAQRRDEKDRGGDWLALPPSGSG